MNPHGVVVYACIPAREVEAEGKGFKISLGSTASLLSAWTARDLPTSHTPKRRILHPGHHHSNRYLRKASEAGAQPLAPLPASRALMATGLNYQHQDSTLHSLTVEAAGCKWSPEKPLKHVSQRSALCFLER